VIKKLPLPEIGGVGDKHPHDSDHAECNEIAIFGVLPHRNTGAGFAVLSHHSLSLIC